MSRPARISPVEPASHLRHIPIRDIGEPLVALEEHAPSCYWVPRHPVFAYHRIPVGRLGLVTRLEAAAKSLPDGYRLAIVECWRAPEIQQQMRQATFDRLRAANPQWSPQRLGREVSRFSAPIDKKAPPPHSTGGAVDVHLVGADDKPLDFFSPFEMTDPRAAPAFQKGLSHEAERNRAILREAMLGAGLTNYPSEWWHWSFGDQAWAYRGGHETAIYSAIRPEGLTDADLEFSVHETPGF